MIKSFFNDLTETVGSNPLFSLGNPVLILRALFLDMIKLYKLYNIFIVVQYRKSNTYLQQMVHFSRVKVILTHKQNLFASTIYLNLCKIILLTTYSKDKRNKKATSNEL